MSDTIFTTYSEHGRADFHCDGRSARDVGPLDAAGGAWWLFRDRHEVGRADTEQDAVRFVATDCLRFWLSWEEPGDDPRPLTLPLPAGVVGWWCTGEAGDGMTQMICAVVDAPDAASAKALIERKGAWMPRAWRFCEQRSLSWMPPEDRFPHA